MPRFIEFMDRSYQEILDRMIASIPQHIGMKGKWTNHNPSDPGITILEMLAWVAHATLYRMDHVPQRLHLYFLKLVAGASTQDEIQALKAKEPNEGYPDPARRKLWEALERLLQKPEEVEIPKIQKEILEFVQSPYRAIAKEDFQNLAKNIIYYDDKGNYDDNGNEQTISFARVEVRPNPPQGEVELILIPDPGKKYNGLYVESRHDIEKNSEDNSLNKLVKNFFLPRMIIGTRVKVRLCDRTQVSIQLKLTYQPGTLQEKIKERVKNEIRKYLHPIYGGKDGFGWLYDKPLSAAELMPLVLKVPGVKSVEVKINKPDNEKIEGIVQWGEDEPKIDFA